MRIYGAALILVVALLPYRGAIRRRDIIQLVPFAMIGFVFGQGLYFQAISRLDIAVVLVVVFTRHSWSRSTSEWFTPKAFRATPTERWDSL